MKKLLLAIVFVLLLAGCCRPMTELQMQKWERRHPFGSPPGKTFGLHIGRIFQKKNTFYYKN